MIGQRIKQARIASGLTQDEVVEALATMGTTLTKAGLSKYERGGSVPKPSTLRDLARVLGVDSSYFLEEPSFVVQWLAFRKGSRLGKTKQARIKAVAESQIEAILTLQNAMEPKPEVTNLDTPPRKSVRQPDDAEHAAEWLRSRWQLGEQPIESVTTAIEDGGGLVVESGGEEDLFDGLAGWTNMQVPVVVVSSAVSDDRRRFSLAHELGHLFMDVGDADEKTEEKLTHRFAVAFLVTANTARRELGRRRRRIAIHELALLKQKHGLSMQAWIFRAADLGIIEQAHARTLFAEMSSRGWRREEPVRFEGEERPQKLRLLTVRALAEGLLTIRQAQRLCPDVTRDASEKPFGAPNARWVWTLPKEERDALMEKAAPVVADEYADGGSLCGFESLAEEDHRDDSLDD